MTTPPRPHGEISPYFNHAEVHEAVCAALKKTPDYHGSFDFDAEFHHALEDALEAIRLKHKDLDPPQHRPDLLLSERLRRRAVNLQLEEGYNQKFLRPLHEAVKALQECGR